MPRNLLLSAAVLPLLAGCGLGWPFTQHPDPNAAQAVQQAGPLVTDCQGRFKSWLGATDVQWQTGPIITRTGNTVSIRLEAQPTSSTAIDALHYGCEYEGSQLTLAGPVH